MASRGYNAIEPTSLATLKPTIETIRQSNIDKYNPENIRIMEEYIDAQARENYYDLEGNLLLLKLYQLNPGGSYSAARAAYVAKVLLKALMQLPRNDFQICKALTEPELTRVLRIQDVLRLEVTLETCQFDFFWIPTLRTTSQAGWYCIMVEYEATQKASELTEELEKCRDTVSGVEGFDNAIHICSVIGMTNQTINERLLQMYLGKLPHENFKKLVQDRGWKFTGNGVVTIKDQTSQIKPRKITEAIDFADVATILSAAARH